MTKNAWKSGITKCSGTYCGVEFSGIIVDSMAARNTACDLKVKLDSPIIVFGQKRETIIVDSESVTIRIMVLTDINEPLESQVKYVLEVRSKGAKWNVAARDFNLQYAKEWASQINSGIFEVRIVEETVQRRVIQKA